MKFTNHEFFRFILVGIINTGSTYLIYLFCLMFFSYMVSYTVAYISGILISYCLNTKYVFSTNFTLKKFIQFPVVYLVQYLLGLGVLFVSIKLFSLNAKIAPIFVVVITIPVTYLLSKLVLQKKNCDEDSALFTK